MKRASINSFRRDAYGLVLEESERRLRPLAGTPPKSAGGPATPAEPPRGAAKLKGLDLALLAALVVGAAGFWFAVGKLLVRAWAMLISHVN